MSRTWRLKCLRISVTKYWICTLSQLQKQNSPHLLHLLVRDLLSPCLPPILQLLHKQATLHHHSLHSRQVSHHHPSLHCHHLSQPLQLHVLPQWLPHTQATPLPSHQLLPHTIHNNLLQHTLAIPAMQFQLMALQPQPMHL